MQIIYEYSHLGGSEILTVRYPDHEKEIYGIISQVTAIRTKISKEKTMRGKKLYSPKDMNQQFTELFIQNKKIEAPLPRCPCKSHFNQRRIISNHARNLLKLSPNPLLACNTIFTVVSAPIAFHFDLAFVLPDKNTEPESYQYNPSKKFIFLNEL